MNSRPCPVNTRLGPFNSLTSESLSEEFRVELS
jgi:hypothetical protein